MLQRRDGLDLAQEPLGPDDGGELGPEHLQREAATQDGVLVKSGNTAQRYVGTIYASGANTTEDSFAKRYVWNYYNRVARPMRVTEATDTWTYTTAAFRQANGAAANAMLERDVYLSKIDGIMFGDDPSQGVIRDRLFVHPPLRFAFEVPSGYKLVNLPDVVAIKGPKGTLGNLSLADPQPGGSLVSALQNYDPKGNIVLQDIETLTINGMEAATGRARVNTKSGAANYRAVLIRHPSGKVYEFAFVSLADLGARYDSDFQKTAFSFRQISAAEAAQYNKPQRLRVVTVQPGDTIQSLSSRMVVGEAKEQWFRVLNALENANSVQPGQKVKIVTY